MVAPAASAATQVEVTGLSGGSIANLGFSAGSGEIVGLTGLIGSGYDEIPYLLYGAKPATGDLRLGGKVVSLSELRPRAAIDSGIVLIPADRPGAGAIGALSVADNVTIPVIGIGLRRWLLNRGELFRTAAALGEQFDVRPPDPRLAMSNLSGGNQQKVLLAKWFQRSPRLVLLDEPTQGVDVGARQTVFRHIANAASAGATVLCASSDYGQLAAICSRVLIFSGGRIVATLVGSEITKEAIAERSLGALAA
jgi:ribose transport system ATP-binding protein